MKLSLLLGAAALIFSASVNAGSISPQILYQNGEANNYFGETDIGFNSTLHSY